MNGIAHAWSTCGFYLVGFLEKKKFYPSNYIVSLLFFSHVMNQF